MYNKKLARRYGRRKRRLIGAAIVSGICATVVSIFIIIAFNILFVDRFTVTTSNESELCLTLDEDKLKQTTTLSAPPLLRASDTQYSDIPDNIEEGLGSKNTDYYFAYSFYLGGLGPLPSINYNLDVSLNKYSNGLEEAIRVMVIRNGDRNIYAKPNEDGSAKLIYSGNKTDTEPEVIGVTKPFTKNRHIIVEAYEISPGDFDKYTIVIWIDGWESVNEMKGGVFSADVKFSTHSIND